MRFWQDEALVNRRDERAQQPCLRRARLLLRSRRPRLRSLESVAEWTPRRRRATSGATRTSDGVAGGDGRASASVESMKRKRLPGTLASLLLLESSESSPTQASLEPEDPYSMSWPARELWPRRRGKAEDEQRLPSPSSAFEAPCRSSCSRARRVGRSTAENCWSTPLRCSTRADVPDWRSCRVAATECRVERRRT